MARFGFYLILAVGVGAGLLFAIHPRLDLHIAALFFGTASKGLIHSDNALINGVRVFNLALIVGVIGLCASAVLTRMISLKAPVIVPSRAACLVLLTYLVGPGLVANALLKENWARPRPGHVVEFGGAQTFRPWWDPRGSCPRNCSFVSGEASGAFATLALAAVAPLGWRYRAVGAAVLYGGLIGGIRVMVGGHFASDVIFAGVFTALVVWAAHGFIYRWDTRVGEREAEARIAALSRTLRERFAVSLNGLSARLAQLRMALGAEPSVSRAAVRVDRSRSV